MVVLTLDIKYARKDGLCPFFHELFSSGSPGLVKQLDLSVTSVDRGFKSCFGVLPDQAIINALLGPFQSNILECL